MVRPGADERSSTVGSGGGKKQFWAGSFRSPVVCAISTGGRPAAMLAGSHRAVGGPPANTLTSRCCAAVQRAALTVSRDRLVHSSAPVHSFRNSGRAQRHGRRSARERIDLLRFQISELSADRLTRTRMTASTVKESCWPMLKRTAQRDAAAPSTTTVEQPARSEEPCRVGRPTPFTDQNPTPTLL